LKKIIWAVTFILPFFYALNTNAQLDELKYLSTGEIHGNFQLDVQYYNPDSIIGADPVPEKILANGFSNVIYTKEKFSAGLRFETYQNPMLGFDTRYRGTGLPYKFLQYKVDKLEVTVGNYFEQFGSGIIFRTYEERGLGYDNAMEGVRLKYTPIKGIYLKGILGKQRFYFSSGEGIVRGFDAEFNVNEIFDSLLYESKGQLILGGSAVSKFEADNNPNLILPENVAAFSGRMNFIYGKINLLGEYAYKINDPSTVNNQIYRKGEALLLQANYSQKGLGVSLSAKRIDNMNFRSQRNATNNDLLINYMPALTRQHTYNLPASIYPYATQPNGEMGAQAEVTYKLKRGTKLGGTYGTDIIINYSFANGLDTTKRNDGYGYDSEFFKLGKSQYFKDFNIEITRKWNKKIKTNVMYMYTQYNKDVVQGLRGYGTIYANIAVVDVSWFINPYHTLRFESQGLFAKQDEGSWGMLLAEYTFSPSWFVAVMDQYNYGNPDENKRVHYLMGTFGYIKGGNRISMSYGRQREGILCVGGVCRLVPATNGLSLSVTSTF
jgi:hypothetical protein